MSAIVPSILTNSVDDFVSKLNTLSSFPDATEVHVDFADDRFVPNKTVSPASLPKLPLKQIFEAHLMVRSPQDYFEDIEKCGFESAVFHIETYGSTAKVSEAVEKLKNLGLEPRIAINPGTPMEQIKTFFNKVDHVVVMSVQPGFYGGKYVPETEDRIRFLRDNGFYGTITVDGGIDRKKIKTLILAGVDRFIIGSAIFAAKDPKAAYIDLVEETKI